MNVFLEGGPLDGQTHKTPGYAHRFVLAEITANDRLVDHVYELEGEGDQLRFVYRGAGDQGRWSEITQRITAENVKFLFEDCTGTEQT